VSDVQSGGWRSFAERLVREPLLALRRARRRPRRGARRARSGDERRHIAVDASVRRGLRQDHLRRTGVVPSAEEERRLIERYVEEEVLYREALALGLDRGDVIIRRRLLQKMEFLADEAEPIPEPTDADLAAFLAAHPARYATEPRVALTQVFVATDRHGDAAETIATDLRAKLAAGADPATLGDPFPRGSDFGRSSERELAAVFGTAFAARAVELSDGAWSEPIRSSYGFHVVRPSARVAGGPPRLDEVRNTVRVDWLAEKRAARRRAALDALRRRYDVDVAP
jgi:hypothetical protein